MSYFTGILASWSIGFVASLPVVLAVSIFRQATRFAEIGAEIRGA